MLTLDEWRSSGHFFEREGHRLFYVDSGGSDLPCLLLVHGFPTAGWDFAAVYPALAETHRVIVPDMLGFGFSDKPRGHDYSIVEQAGLIDALLGSLGIAEAAVLAHDYGDSVAQELMARQIDGDLGVHLTGVCLLNGGLFPETHRPRLVQRLLLSPAGPMIGRAMSQRAFDRSMRAIFGQATQPSRAELDGFWTLVNAGDGRQIVHRLIRYMPEREAMRERWLGGLRNSAMPLGLINGSADPVSGEHMVARFEQLVERPHFIRRLPGIGHYPQVEAPVDVLDAYRAFVDDALGSR